MIEIKNLGFQYQPKSKKVFSDFSLNIEKGKIYGLLGKNGTGKTTLLYLLCGLLRPQKGSIIYHNIPTYQRKFEVLKDFFFVSKDFDLPNITLKKYVQIYGSLYPNFSTETLQRCLNKFEMDEDIRFSELSTGQKKKVYLSFALATNTNILILDEPTHHLDIPSKSQFKKIISGEMNEERCIIISTHLADDINNLLDHIIIINKEEILLNASVNEITKILAFDEIRIGEETENIIYQEPSLTGNKVINLNEQDIDSTINLELLFNAIHEKSDELKQLFNHK